MNLPNNNDGSVSTHQQHPNGNNSPSNTDDDINRERGNKLPHIGTIIKVRYLTIYKHKQEELVDSRFQWEFEFK